MMTAVNHGAKTNLPVNNIDIYKNNVVKISENTVIDINKIRNIQFIAHFMGLC